MTLTKTALRCWLASGVIVPPPVQVRSKGYGSIVFLTICAGCGLMYVAWTIGVTR